MVTVTTPEGQPGDSRIRDPAGFGRVVLAWFLSLTGLYVLYMWTALPGSESGILVQQRLLMVFGPTTVVLSLLISPAVFVAASERFHPFSGEVPARGGAHWGHLALSAVAACLLSVLGPRIAVFLMTIAADGLREDALVAQGALATTRLLIPLAMGLLALCSGVAGALIGQATANWRRRRRDGARWLACLAMIVSFLLPLLATMSLIQRGHAPAYMVLVSPLAIPLIVVTALVWRLRDTLDLRLPRRQSWATMDAEALDRIITAVNTADEHPEQRLRDLTNTDLELEMAHLVAGIRREIGVRAMIPEARVDEIVTAILAAPPPIAPRHVSSTKPVVEPGQAGVFVTSWACLAAGLMIVSPLGGVPISLLSAAGVGLLGSIGVMLIAHRYPSLHDTVPI